MSFLYPENWPQFFTATIHGWKNLLQEDQYKNIIIDSLIFLKEKNRIKLNGYVIMSNHVHFTCLPAGRFGRHFQGII